MPHLLPAAASAIAQAAPAAAAAAAKATVMGTLKSVAFNALTSLAISSALSVFSPTVGASARQVEFVIDPDGPIPFAAGRVGVSGSVVHRDTFGPDLMYYGIPFVLSGAGPITAIESFMADDYPMAFDANGGAVTEPYRQELFFRSVLGFQPAPVALSTPGGLKKGATLPGWTGAHKLSGKAAGLIVMAENSKGSAFPTGEIKPLIQLLGLKGWDPTLDSTYPGGDGPCRLNDAATWVTLTCPILWGLKWALGLWEGPSLKGAPAHDSLTDHQVGGIGVRLSGVDVPAFVSASNIAKANGWTVSAYPNTDDDKHQVLETFLQSGGATYAQRAGKISCISRAAPRASLVTISARDTAGPLEIDTAASRIDRINTLRPRFWSPAHRWQMTAMTGEVTAQAYRDEDGGRTRSRGIDFPFVSDARQTGQLAALQIANTREGIAGVVPLKSHLQRIRPGDAFTITEPGFVLDGLKCLCLNTDYNAATGVVRVSFVSETDGKYPFALGQNPTPPSRQVLTPVDPRFVTPPDAGDWTVTPRPPSQGGAQQPGFDLTGFVSNATATAIIVETGPTDDGPWTQAYQGPPTVTNIPIDGLQPGATYFIAIQYQRNQNYSAREVFGPFTAPDLVAGDLSPDSPVWTEIELQGVAIGEVTGRLQTVEDIADANTAAVADLETVYGDTASAAASAATAAQAKADAILAKADAVQAKTDAVAAAGASASSASQAGGFKTDAEAASAAATEQKLAAEAARDVADAKASASAQSAANASASETEAGVQAAASQSARNAADAARGQAETYRNETATARDTAQGAAATATAQAGLSASSAGASQAAANSPLATSPALSPDAFNVNNWSTLNAPANLRQFITDNPGKVYFASGGSTVEVNNFASAVHFSTSKGVTRPAGHRFRFTARVQRMVNGGDATTNHVTLYLWSWDAAGNEIGGVTLVDQVVPTNDQGLRTLTAEYLPPANAAWIKAMVRVYSVAGVTSVHSVEAIDIESEKVATAAATASVGSASTASTKADEAGVSASAASAAKIASELARDNASGSASASATSAGQSLTYRNQAGEFASASSGSATTAATKAGEAATSAQQASTSAGNANTAAISASVSASAAGRAAESTLPSTFEEGTRFFGTVTGVGLTIGDINQTVYFPTVAGIGKVLSRDGFVEYGTKGVIALKPGRIHRIRSRGRIVQNGPNDTHQWVTGFQIYDANGSILNQYWTEFTGIKRHADGWVDLGGGGATTEDIKALAPNATYIRPYLLQGWGASVYPGSISEVSFLRYEDITDSAAAAASAASALTQAASASASASSASISANLAASAGAQSSVVNNGRFINWPTGQARPTGWNDWANCNQDPNIQSGYGWGGRRFVRMNYQPSMGDQGMSIDIEGFRGTAEPYNLDIEVSIPNGGPTGTGFHGAMVLMQCLDISGGYVGDAVGQPKLWLEKDINGVVPGPGSGDGRIYRFNSRVNLVPGTFKVRLYLMSRWTVIGPPGANEAKSLDWYSVSLTPMSGAESSVPALAAQLSVTTAVAVDTQTRMASTSFEVIGSSGGDPAQLLVKTTGTSSLVQLVASALRFGNVIGGQIVDVMKLVGGSVFITGKLLLGAAGQIELDPAYPLILWKFGSARLAIGQIPNDQLFFWFGPSVEVSQMRRNNATVYMDRNGRGHWMGAITAGTISNSIQGSNSVVPVSATLGPFSTNGGPIVVNWSYSLDRAGVRWGNQTGGVSGTTSALVRLYQKIGTGAETVVDTMTVNGDLSATYDGEPVPGQPSGTVGQTFFTEYMGASKTYTDNVGGTAARTYRVEVASRSNKNVSGSSATADGISQRYGATSSE